MKHIYSVMGVCLCAALLAACGASEVVYPAVTTSHAAPLSQAQRHANPFIRNEFVYVANGGSSNISAYKVGRGGALTPVAGSPFAVGIPPTTVAVDESGKFAYASSPNYPNPTGTISAYKISPFSGTLTPISGSPYTEGNGPYAVAVDPRGGNFAYAVNVFSSNVSAYQINQHSGALNALRRLRAGGQPEALAIDPLGRFLFVPNTESNNVSAYTIDSSSGRLTNVAGSPFGAGTTPNSAAVDPTGAFLYLTNPNSDNISGYAIDQSSGALTPVAGSPFGVTGNPQAVAVDPSGRFAYVVISTVGIDAFTIDPITGALTQVAGSPFGGGFPNRLTVDLKGSYLYVSNGNDIDAFVIDQSSGALTAVAGSPFAAGTGPGGIAVWGSQ
jgi:6-phosphogluconolactonase